MMLNKNGMELRCGIKMSLEGVEVGKQLSVKPLPNLKWKTFASFTM
jgi:hypothetical protein